MDQLESCLAKAESVDLKFFIMLQISFEHGYHKNISLATERLHRALAWRPIVENQRLVAFSYWVAGKLLQSGVPNG